MKLRTLLGVLVAAVSLWTWARTELPVTQVNGEACYSYTVGEKQTLYSVADELGLTRDEIVKYNPGAADGIRKGQKLFFPVDRFPDLGNNDREQASQSGTYTVRKGDSFYGICYKLGVSSDALLAANPSIASGVKVGQVLTVPSEALRNESQQEAEEEKETGENRFMLKPVIPVVEVIEPGDTVEKIEKTANIVVMLPFMLDNEEYDKHALNVTDFYKGFLMAADSLSNKNGNINIYTFDTEASDERVKNFCLTDTFRNAAVVIPPDNNRQLEIIASAAMDNDVYVFNAFVVRDSSYMNNPLMLQSYIPSEIMLRKAAEALRNLYPGVTPVVLHRNGGRDDKADFISHLKEIYADSETPLMSIDFDETLTVSDLARLPEAGSYVLVPESGNLNEFNKLSAAILEAQEDATGGSVYYLFGYPDWTGFRGPNRDMLHRLGATIYTRFYNDPFSSQVKQLEAKYNGEYGGSMLDAVPVPALLGFDCGNFLINNLRRGESRYLPVDDAFYGSQSSFRFVKANPSDDGSGYYNDELYIIRFSPDGIHTDRLQ